MMMDEVIARIGEIGIVPVVRAPNVEQARRAVEAICAGGIPIVEITMTVPNAPEVIRTVVREYGSRVLTGAGTVLRSSDAKCCLDAGAEFVVSPGFSAAVVAAASASGKLAIPGAMTPTELMLAFENEARLVKIFPCGNLGGPKYLKSLKAPFPNAALIPTGGVNASNAAEYLKAGAFALGIGADLVDVVALREGNLKKISDAAQELVAAVRGARAPVAASRSVL
jgi:2-dehydro-3-deoxyphosphogluconate aldolase/(4S)-4-hydroxy-2-oxoglutarate aldolase